MHTVQWTCSVEMCTAQDSARPLSLAASSKSQLQADILYGRFPSENSKLINCRSFINGQAPHMPDIAEYPATDMTFQIWHLIEEQGGCLALKIPDPL